MVLGSWPDQSVSRRKQEENSHYLKAPLKMTSYMVSEWKPVIPDKATDRSRMQFLFVDYLFSLLSI